MAAPAVRRERYDARTVWGFFMRRRILDWGFSLLDGEGMG